MPDGTPIIHTCLIPVGRQICKPLALRFSQNCSKLPVVCPLWTNSFNDPFKGSVMGKEFLWHNVIMELPCHYGYFPSPCFCVLGNLYHSRRKAETSPYESHEHRLHILLENPLVSGRFPQQRVSNAELWCLIYVVSLMNLSNKPNKYWYAGDISRHGAHDTSPLLL